VVHTVSVLRGPRSLLVVVSAVVAVVACSSSDGRSLPPPDPKRTTTSVSAPVVGQPSDGDAASLVEVFSLGSPSFPDGGVIPARHTCAGDDVSPALTWSATPPAAELALVVRDRSAGGFVHWVVTGIDPAVQGFGEGGIPETAVEASNGAGTQGWSGPCPPAGSGAHTYDFVLHALPEPLALAPGLPADEAAQLVEGASSAQAVLTGTATEDPSG
jgi:Raf kinase inhibitor-like YbhB/YbcL family protein